MWDTLCQLSEIHAVLFQHEILDFIAGTIVSRNRLLNCPLKIDAVLKNNGLGSCDTCVRKEDKIVVLQWYDNEVVILATTFLSENSKDIIKRLSNKYSTYIDVCRPKFVQFYNKSKGSVNKYDFLLSLYWFFISEKNGHFEWYLIILVYSMAIINSWLEYKNDATCLQVLLQN